MRRSIFMVAVFCLCLGTIAKAAGTTESDRGTGRYAKALDRALAMAASAKASLACPVILPEEPFAVAPNQPPIDPESTRGIVNALCQVTLNIVGCRFSPTLVQINCDSNGDGIPEALITLQNVTQVNGLLTRATLVPITPELPGTAFPLACCGGAASITMSRTVTAGDDNVFGPFTESQTCPIDLGIRAPVVISASPSDGQCAVPQNLVITGSCFILANGVSNVTSVFAVESGNPANVIHATRFVLLTPNLIDALFNFGTTSAGKRFLIFVSGPNGTSRNLTSLPSEAPAGCPPGNEQGVPVTFLCSSQTTPGSPGGSPPQRDLILGCKVDRNAAGGFELTLASTGLSSGSSFTVGGVQPKKVKFRDAVGPDLFQTIVLKGKFCKGLPGQIVVDQPGDLPSVPFACSASCR